MIVLYWPLSSSDHARR